jgi:hypothetical protein
MSSVTGVLSQINRHLGETEPEPAPPFIKQPGRVLHLTFDLDQRRIVGASVAGKILDGPCAAHLSRDDVSVTNHRGEELLGELADVTDTSKAAADIADFFSANGIRPARTSKVEQDILKMLGEDDGE